MLSAFSTSNEPRFLHHTLDDFSAAGKAVLIPAPKAPPTDSSHVDQSAEVATALRHAGVARVVLIHGTFAGNDVVGVAREIARLSPGLAERLRQLGKEWFDDLAGEVGNYTQAYVDALAQRINPPSLDPITVTRMEWSGENHHLGRADAAMNLVGLVAQDGPAAGERVLCLAHSHGGNVLAMLSQIAGADPAVRDEFFASTRLHYRVPLLGRVDLPAWSRTSDFLDLHAMPALDVATFGTPLRYRWNNRVCKNLIHFVQHRSLDPDHPQRAVFPRTIEEMTEAAGGDYAQQLGTAGTDFLPSVFAIRDWIVERRMRRMFEATVRRRDLRKRLQLGRRESVDGTTLLVDYPDTSDRANRKLLGHGVYTDRQWMSFHLQEIVKRFYA